MIQSLLKKLTNTFYKPYTVKSLLVVVFGLLTSVTLQGQVSSYNVQQLQGTFTSLPSPAGVPGNKIALSSTSTATDDGVFALPLPFNFTFNGVAYLASTNIRVSMNGFVTFGATVPTLTNVNPITSTETYAGAIAVFGRDLDLISPSTTANVSYHVTGTAPNRVLIVEWLVRRSNAATAGIDINNFPLQVHLYETTNVIEMRYGAINFSATTTLFGQVGLRGAGNTDFKMLDHSPTTNWPGIAPAPVGSMLEGSDPALHSGYAVRTRGGTVSPQPNSNRLFRWTPDPCPSPSSVTVSNVAINTADVAFVAPTIPPSNGYVYEVRTSGAAGSGPLGLAQSGATPSNPFTLSGLTAGTTYTVYIRSFCGGSIYGQWVASASFTTFCTAVFPYSEFINPLTGFTVPALPPCTSRQNAGLGNNWVSTTPAPSMVNEHMIYNFNGSFAADAWFYTRGVNLVAGEEYRISYTYGGSSQFTFITNKMEVKYGTSPVNTAMTIPIDNHPIIKTSPLNNVVNFTAPSTGVFYFGFHAYSDANNGELYLDNIEIVASNCKKPTGLTAPPALISFNSALVSWTAPTPAPSAGYTYFLSTVNPVKVAGSFIVGSTYTINTIGTTNYTLIGATSNAVGVSFIATGVGAGSGTATEQLSNVTPPTGTVGAGTTVANLNGLTPSTTYYVWVRSNCAANDFSQWSNYVTFTTASPPPSYCLPSGNGFLQDPNGILNVTMGTINNTTGIEPNNYGNYSNLSTNVIRGATIPTSITFGTGFTYDTNIWVDWNNDGDFDDAGESVYTGVSAAPNPSTLNASFAVPLGQPLGTRRLRIGSIDGPGFAGGALTPCRNGAYQAFEDYTINVIDVPPALTLSSNTSTQCAGTASPLVTITAGLVDYQSFSWSPSTGVSGTAASGYTFTNSSTTTYTLTANQTSGSFSTNSVSFVYVANDVPTLITIATPSGTVACPQGPAIPLVASGGVVSNVTIYNDNFNSGLGAWTATNTSSGGANTAAPAWTALPSGSVVGSVTVVSNDNSQFVVSNSDAQGGTPAPSVTRTSITSPPINLAGYQTASLSFFQYFNWIAVSDIAVVEVTNDAGASWTTLASYTADQGSASNFSQAIVNLNTYAIAGNTIQVRFRYQSNWGWWWAIDNFRISGSATSAIVWSPTAGLFTDAAGTIPYTGTGASTVYAISSIPQTYTATASTPGPTICTVTGTVSLTVSPIVAGTASGNQTICSGLPSNLTLTGNVGTITGWQYSNTLSFTVPVSIPASASATLTSAQMGTLSSSRYYRAVVTNGGCTSFSNIVSVLFENAVWNGTTWSNGTGPSNIISAEFQGNYSSLGNLNACSVLVTSGNVIINEGHTLTVQTNVRVLGGGLTFENQSSLYQVQDVSNGVGVYSGGNSGNITSIRYAAPMFRFDYTYWSTPVNPMTLLAVSPESPTSLAYEFNSSINNWVYFNPNNTMVPGRGYIFRAPSWFNLPPPASPPNFPLTHMASFVGVPNNGTITVPVIGGGGAMNLLGNPYPSALNADDLIAANPAINGTIYFWTHNSQSTPPFTYNPADYASYNGTGFAATTSGAGNSTAPLGSIASGQGFFVEGLSTGTVTYSNAMREAGNNTQFYRMNGTYQSNSTLEKHRYWINITGEQNAFKQILIGYVATATNGMDRLFDGKMIDALNSVTLYTKVDDEKLSIQGRTLPFDINETLPLSYKSPINGTYTISLAAFDGLFEDQAIYIEDTQLGVIHNLKESSYTFTTEIGSFDTRFVLRYTTESLGTDNPIFNENTVVVYKNQQGLHVSSGNVMMENVTIFDIRGRQIAVQKHVGDTETVFTTLPSTQQVLLVKITSVDGVVVTKKVVY
jgi:hypothetical protein